jgi:hypothetical protein
MLRHLRRRHLLRWVAFYTFSVALFAGGIWLALHLAGSSPTRVVRVRDGAASRPAQYTVQPNDGGVRIHQQVGPGHVQDLVIKNTANGVLISPVPPNK